MAFEPPKYEKPDDAELVRILEGYRTEAEDARRGGLNPRDDKWRENLNLYWNRYDFSEKAQWQAKEALPEVPAFVDRFAAALKEALIANPGGFYNVMDPADEDQDLGWAIKRMTDMWLSRSGRNANGMPLGFEAVFDEQVKLGALMACSASVTWKNDVPGGRVAIETVDPRNVWLDATYRDLYRIRREFVDRHMLYEMANRKDIRGRSIWKAEGVSELVNHLSLEDAARRAELTGDGQVYQQSGNRHEITLDEYYCTVLDKNGTPMPGGKQLVVVANGSAIVRGPEPNPFQHGQDWLVFAPLVTVPLSVYGRSYMEDFGSIARTFNELTNMLLDAVHSAGLNVFALVPEMLINPAQATDGVWPNKTFLLEAGSDVKQFANSLAMGTVSAEGMRLWEAMKNELREAAGVNEIGLGQFAPKGRTSATEVQATQQSSSALVRSVAQSIETRFLDPVLDRVWKTGLQHASVTDQALAGAVGNQAMFAALMGQKKQLLSHPMTFQARGITYLIQKQAQLQSLLQIIQVVSANEILLQQFLAEADPAKLLDRLLSLSNIDKQTLQPTERERLKQAVVQAGAQGAGGGAGPGAEAAQAAGLGAEQ